MVVANVTALFIFHGEDVLFRRGRPPEIGHGFGFFHWLAVVTLVLVLLGRFAASRQRQAFFAYAHPVCMILSYWMLMGGAVNEVFDRVDWVKRMALAISPGARSIAGYKLLYIVYYINDAVILAALAIATVPNGWGSASPAQPVANIATAPGLSASTRSWAYPAKSAAIFIMSGRSVVLWQA